MRVCMQRAVAVGTCEEKRIVFYDASIQACWLSFFLVFFSACFDARTQSQTSKCVFILVCAGLPYSNSPRLDNSIVILSLIMEKRLLSEKQKGLGSHPLSREKEDNRQ